MLSGVWNLVMGHSGVAEGRSGVSYRPAAQDRMRRGNGDKGGMRAVG